MAQIYWAARDLDSFFWGNHQFILIFLEQDENLSQTLANVVMNNSREVTNKFVTLAGHQPDGDLIFVPNQSSDVRSVNETFSAGGISPDLDLEKHSITPPNNADGLTFALQLETLAYNYQRNTANAPIDYDLLDGNCSTWVNTLFKVAGVPRQTRLTAGEFHGFDWGEEDLLDENLFR